MISYFLTTMTRKKKKRRRSFKRIIILIASTCLTSTSAAPIGRPSLDADHHKMMFKGEKADLVMFGFVLIMIILVSGLFSCMVHVVSRQSGKLILSNRARRIGGQNRGQKSAAAKRFLFDGNEKEIGDYEEADCRCYSASAAKEDILY